MEEGTFTDIRDGKKYRTVVIGNQIWMAENLNYNAEGSKCYDNKPANGQKYGRLYDWNAAMKACPKGWHLPSDAEWQELIGFAGGKRIAGNRLKARDGWDNSNGIDDLGFSALPSGYCCNCSFGEIGSYGHWWSANEHNRDNAYNLGMRFNKLCTEWNDFPKSFLFSVRCLKD
jgi:uncharacterized protein (TIGR02145 family)